MCCLDLSQEKAAANNDGFGKKHTVHQSNCPTRGARCSFPLLKATQPHPHSSY